MRPSVIAGLLALLGACGTSLEEHEALWAAKGPASYQEALGDPTRVFSDCGIEGDGWRVTDFAAVRVTN